jgi:hypothetical protein
MVLKSTHHESPLAHTYSEHPETEIKLCCLLKEKTSLSLFLTKWSLKHLSPLFLNHSAAQHRINTIPPCSLNHVNHFPTPTNRSLQQFPKSAPLQTFMCLLKHCKTIKTHYYWNPKLYIMFQPQKPKNKDWSASHRVQFLWDLWLTKRH